MHSWTVHDAQARFGELLENCLTEGPQIVTRRGLDAAVLVSMTEWRRMQANAQPALKKLLLTDLARCELNLPERSGTRRRPVASMS